ncbi:pyrroline-5-carboxylate reductase [Candidatus Magnetomorum sp. HK-1]|nr:pyrroline-5-carboxylate reductase [Candidatus Magnetomorum sp. HK-1]
MKGFDETMIKNKRIGFIGAGNMAEAFISGLIDKIIPASQIQVSDIDKNRLNLIHDKYGVHSISNNNELFQNNDIIILSVKPQVMKTILTEIKPSQLQSPKLIISIAAGIAIKTIEQYLYDHLDTSAQKLLPVIRVMPNTPALVQMGMSAFCGNQFATEKDINTVIDILSAMGKVIAVSEDQMDGITAISGSGPAYIFYFIESMIQAAENLGFSEDASRLLVLQTAEGALQLLKQPGANPVTLREQVTSKGGTTEAAIRVMTEHQVKKTIIDAIKNAENRAKELSQM